MEEKSFRKHIASNDNGPLSPEERARVEDAEIASDVPDPADSPRGESLADLLDGIEKFVRRFIVLGDDEATAIALWIAHTYVFETFDITPYLFISSPEKQCGKTTLLEVIELLSHGSLRADNITEAALYRAIEGSDPTLLIDEIETIFSAEGSRETMRGILNAGFRRGGQVLRCVGEGTHQEVRPFNVFCPKAFAGIGKRNLPDTINDRSIEIRMRKKTRGEQVERARHRFLIEEAEPIKKKLEAFEWDFDPENLNPDLPEELDDRGQDCWEPLLAIADYAGGVWGERARKAALALSVNGDRENVSHRVELLSAVRDVFDSLGVDRISTNDLIRHLAENQPEAFWGEWWDEHAGKPAHGKARKLASILHEFGGRPKDIRFEAGKAKGYEREDLDDAFDRYALPVPGTETSATSETPTKPGDVADAADVADSDGRKDGVVSSLLDENGRCKRHGDNPESWCLECQASASQNRGSAEGGSERPA
jgi:hypothetical protein